MNEIPHTRVFDEYCKMHGIDAALCNRKESWALKKGWRDTFTSVYAETRGRRPHFYADEIVDMFLDQPPFRFDRGGRAIERYSAIAGSLRYIVMTPSIKDWTYHCTGRLPTVTDVVGMSTMERHNGLSMPVLFLIFDDAFAWTMVFHFENHGPFFVEASDVACETKNWESLG